MHIDQLVLKNYRNYEQASLELSPKLNIFIGNNAQGKTNLLESIYVTGFGKSFRTNRDKDLVRMNEDQAHVRVHGIKAYTDVTVDFRLNKQSEKDIRVNGNRLQKRSDLFGALNIVLFSPEDLRLIKEGPSERRKFIDRELSQMSPRYCQALMEYMRIMGQRNELLKQIPYKKSMESMLPVWDEKLAKAGTDVIMRRFKFIKRLSEIAYDIHSGITDEKEELKIEYLSNISVKNDLEYDTIYMAFEERLKATVDRDIKRGYTSVGPHRDDLGIFVNEIDIKQFGSQGQQRTAALSLRLSEIEIIREEVGEYPILLLDDVMSELDSRRQNDLIRTMRDIQTIITITDVESINDAYIKEARIFHVDQGSASPK
ncbi:DNA replication/repair protein RecF [Fusibacter sp. JL216-2]|uniref:DNA replication/repair protein RecF n=1 Tax=Fusibacter sp. JL216-2 TaxID=3071453 RepID=UPI003D339CDD